jgi:ADP-ribose pyrophosphatase YjhB (NUDIX family)
MMHEVAQYRFCPCCGGRLEKRLIKPQEPKRLVCAACGYVFYVDPKLSVIAVIPMDEGVVMVRRAIEPGYGLWVVPGGFVGPLKLLNIYSYRNHRTVIAAYLTEYVSGELTAGDETLEARVFGLKEIPWPQIAFSSTKEALRDYISRFG